MPGNEGKESGFLGLTENKGSAGGAAITGASGGSSRPGEGIQAAGESIKGGAPQQKEPTHGKRQRGRDKSPYLGDAGALII